MRDFSLLAAQVRAARGLLGWTQGYLAEGINISRAVIVDLESAKRIPHESTLFVLMTELAAAGINFTDKGVEFRKWPAKPYVPTGVKQKMPSREPVKKTGGTRKTIKNLKLAPQRR
jgi:transcriptional regulator with XRE-family HTH domain